MNIVWGTSRGPIDKINNIVWGTVNGGMLGAPQGF